MKTAGIKARLLVRFLAVIALLGAFLWAGNAAVAYFASAHPDTLATLIGAAATIFAGYLAWESIFYKSNLEQAEKETLAQLRKEDLVVAITPSIHAATSLAACVEVELSQTGDTVGQSLRVKRHATRLSRVFNAEILIRLMDALGANDRRVLLIIVGTLQSVLSMAELGTDQVLSDDDLKIMRGALTGLHRFVGIFDADLGEVYARDFRPAGPARRV